MTADNGFRKRLLQRAAGRFRPVGWGPFLFGTVKLRVDPVYEAIIRQGLLPPKGRVLDLGCGQALTLSVIRAAEHLHRTGEFAPDWPVPPRDLELQGFEVRGRPARIAVDAMAREAEVRVADLKTADLPRCSAVLLLDVLHYLAPEEQERLLDGIDGALEENGTLLIREADAAGGPGFECVRLSERLRSFLRGDWHQRFHYRSALGWTRALGARGFDATVQSLAGRLPFANVLIRGVRR